VLDGPPWIVTSQLMFRGLVSVGATAFGIDQRLHFPCLYLQLVPFLAHRPVAVPGIYRDEPFPDKLLVDEATSCKAKLLTKTSVKICPACRGPLPQSGGVDMAPDLVPY
jgi:hypothetical protein